MIVTIDGPAGAGKSTAARRLAQRLGFDFLDTGAMYRAVTLASGRDGVDPADESALEKLLASMKIELPGASVILNGEDVTGLIRTPDITARSGPIANSPAVRRQLVTWQRGLAAGRDFVCEGRDQGTIVFPQAECKFFLFADPEERARRRQRDLAVKDPQITLAEVLAAQTARDQRDAARDIAPMKPAADALLVDSTGRTLDDVVDYLEGIVRERIAACGLAHPNPAR